MSENGREYYLLVCSGEEQSSEVVEKSGLRAALHNCMCLCGKPDTCDFAREDLALLDDPDRWVWDHEGHVYRRWILGCDNGEIEVIPITDPVFALMMETLEAAVRFRVAQHHVVVSQRPEFGDAKIARFKAQSDLGILTKELIEAKERRGRKL